MKTKKGKKRVKKERERKTQRKKHAKKCNENLKRNELEKKEIWLSFGRRRNDAERERERGLRVIRRRE